MADGDLRLSEWPEMATTADAGDFFPVLDVSTISGDNAGAGGQMQRQSLANRQATLVTDAYVGALASVAANTAKVTYPSADSTKVGFISVTQAVDLDTMESDIGLNTTHRTSDGSDHTFINQSVESGASPTFDAANITGITSASLPFGSAGEQLTTNEAETGLELSLASKYLLVRKATAGTIAAGRPVYIDSYNPAGFIEVEEADSSSAATMPAVGLTYDSITNGGGGGRVLISGNFAGINTSAFNDGDAVYVSETAGELTATKPTGTALVQKVGTVGRANINGQLVVTGAGRSNDLPNLPNTNVWIGDVNGVPQSFALTGDIAMTAGGVTTIQADAVDIAMLSATGTADNTTFLRGDGQWAAPAGGGGGDLLAANNLSDLANVVTARTNLGVDAAGTDNSTDVTLTGTPDYITIAGQVITVGNVDLTTDVTGVLPIANYATGTPDGTKFVKDDGTLAVPVGSATALSAGTITATTYGITSDGGVDDIVLPEATTSTAGLLGAAKWDEIVANTSHLSSTGADHSYIDQAVTIASTPQFAGLTTTGDIDPTTDNVRDLGNGTTRFKDIHAATLNAGTTPTDTLLIRGYDENASYINYITITSDNGAVPVGAGNSCDLHLSVTHDGNTILTDADIGVGGVQPYDANYAKTNVVNSYTKTQAAARTQLTDAANIDWNLSNNQHCYVVLDGNRTLNTPTNIGVGVYVIEVIQDATVGGRTLAWPTEVVWTGAAPTLSTGVNDRDIFTFVCDGTSLYGQSQAVTGTGDLLADGSIPLTANWDVGAFTITGTQFISDIATGTAPFVVSSTTEVANLKAATATLADSVEGTAVLSTGEVGGTKFLREDGDGTCSWQTVTGGGGLANIVEDTTPQLGAMLDVNGFGFGDGTLELLTFTETALAVNHLDITNAATGGNVIIGTAGDDADVDMVVQTKGNGDYFNNAYRIYLYPRGNSSGLAVDNNGHVTLVGLGKQFNPNDDNSRDIGSATKRFENGWFGTSLNLTVAAVDGPYLDIIEATSMTANPAANTGRLYVLDDTGTTKLYFRDSAGTETDLLAAGGGGGDVTKVGTPSSNQVGVWTGDGTIEGTSGLEYTGANLGVTGNTVVSGVSYLGERTTATIDLPGNGQIWVKDDTPNILKFTDDAGTDFSVVTDTGTQTLTNKTLTSPTLTTPDVGVVGTGTWEATDVAVLHGGTGASTAADARTNLGVVIGTDVQAQHLTLKAEVGTTYTLVLTDDGKYVTYDNAAAITVTVPPNSSVAFPTGTMIIGKQKGAGQVTFAQGSGVTINTPETLLLVGQHSSYSLVKVGTDEWDLAGHLEAA